MIRRFARRRLYQPDNVPAKVGEYGGVQYIPITVQLPTSLQITGLIAEPDKPTFTVLFFHGNAGSAASRAHLVSPLAELGARIIVADYPGYGGNLGHPDEGSIDCAAMSFLELASTYTGPSVIPDSPSSDSLQRRATDSQHQLMMIGHSLGGNVAVRLAAKYDSRITSLVAYNTFGSLRDIAGRIGAAAIGEEYDAARTLSDISIPTTIAHAVADPVVPFGAGRALYNRAADAQNIRFVPLQTTDHQIDAQSLIAIAVDLGQRTAAQSVA